MAKPSKVKKKEDLEDAVRMQVQSPRQLLIAVLLQAAVSGGKQRMVRANRRFASPRQKENKEAWA